MQRTILSSRPSAPRILRALLAAGAFVLASVAVLPGGASTDAFATERRIDGEAPKDPEPKKSVDPEAVFYGDARDWKKPAEVDASLVYAEIAEYKQIREEKLQASDARYGVLLSKANKRFKCAVRKAAKDGEYDLVAKIGSVKGVDSVPAITSAVIGKL
jgi:hypothetical protein